MKTKRLYMNTPQRELRQLKVGQSTIIHAKTPNTISSAVAQLKENGVKIKITQRQLLCVHVDTLEIHKHFYIVTRVE